MSEILLVDDSAMLRLLVSYTLAGDDGFSVREAANADEALRALDADTFSMMLTDYHMPGMDGVQLVQAVREMSEHEHMPVIMMTSDKDPEVQQAALAAGVDEFLLKPFPPSELHSAVRRMLEESMAAESIEIPHRLNSMTLLEAFPYPAMVLDAEHNVVMGNPAYHDLVGTGISDCPPKCREVFHGEYGMPKGCPLMNSVHTGAPAEMTFLDNLRGKLQISVYPMDTLATGGRRLYLHLARPVD